jgi:glycosyltransferase involved in cell wall biosynthesis
LIPIRILTFSTLYPNAAQPRHGTMVENRLRGLLKTGVFEADVIAPVPWFPFRSRFFGSYAKFARAPAVESRYGLAVRHPRYPVVPKVGMNIAATLLAAAVRGEVARAHAARSYALVDAHYLYPDGVAAGRLATELGLPYVLTARGSDVNVLTTFAAPRRAVLSAIDGARRVLTVSDALRHRLVELGAPASRVVTVRNWVDRDAFQPRSGDRLRIEQKLSGFVAVSVGRLDENKGHHLLLQALSAAPTWNAVIVGAGPDEASLRALARALGVSERTRFLGALPQHDLPQVYGAADVTVLASEREGLPNVVLESLACGTPVIATHAGGTPEVLYGAPGCTLLPERSSQAIATALNAYRPNPGLRQAVREFSARFDAVTNVPLLVEIMREAAVR